MNEIENVKQLITLRQQAHDQELNWLRHLLTLAAGTLSVLAALAPATTGSASLCLSGTWVFLAIGICSGAGATYCHVSRARNLATAFHQELLQSLKEERGMQLPVANPDKVFVLAKSAMVPSLLLAVCFLAAFAVLKTMGWG